MREAIEKTIDGHVYTFTQFNATLALKMLTRLMKICGEPLAIAIAAAQSGDKVLDKKQLNAELLSKAVGALVDRLDEDGVLLLVKTMVSEPNILCDGKKVQF